MFFPTTPATYVIARKQSPTEHEIALLPRNDGIKSRQVFACLLYHVTCELNLFLCLFHNGKHFGQVHAQLVQFFRSGNAVPSQPRR
jgi:hypothetical protein